MNVKVAQLKSIIIDIQKCVSSEDQQNLDTTQ